MGQVIVRGLQTEVIERLKERARRNNRSLEAELRVLLTRAAGEDFEAARATVERVRAMFAGRRFSDSAELVREDRDR